MNEAGSGSRLRVLVTEEVHPAALSALSAAALVSTGPGGKDPWARSDLATFSAVIVRLARVTPDVMDRMPALRIIAKQGAGVDNIDVAAARDRGIIVTYAPDATTDAVAEFVVMQILRLARHPERGEQILREQGFHAARSQSGSTELHGNTIGIVGFGRIGRRLAQICGSGFGMTVLAYDAFAPSDSADRVRMTASLDELLERSDIVSIHVPLTDATRGMIGRRELGLMRPSAWLVNTSRGGTVDEAALAAALASRVIAGAAVDVFDVEPPEPGHPFLSTANVLASAHVAGVTEESRLRAGMTVVQDVIKVLRNEAPDHSYPAQGGPASSARHGL